MTDLNADDFFKDAATVLSRLYSTFPRPIAVYVEDVSGADAVDEFGMHSERYLACLAALLWLAEEGYIRYVERIRQEALDQTVLTARAFTLLSSPARHMEPQDVTDLPDSVRVEQSTNLYRLRQALKSGSSVRTRKVMMDVMTQMHGPGA